ncbi:hypothetical protein AAKU64_004643 [Undibacterium sp. GrIS 1.8]|uniref:hypothetical protein n=1 Tax=unclassified Undibacterium TaxID=2630295 RepID=UPI003394C395
MDVKTDFELFPYIGAGELSFDMKQKNVETLLGAPDSVSTNFLKQRVEFRSFMNAAYSADEGSLIHLGFGRQMEGVKYKDIFLFTEQEDVVLQRLIREDQQPFIYLGFIVLLNLGITLTGFHDQDTSQKAITLFSRGTWDKRLPKLKPFKS